MKSKRKPSKGKFIVKTCAFCGDTFYAKRNSAIYCTDSCKVKFFIRRTTTPQWYSHDPNEGKKLPPGTVTSWEMPEDKLVFTGELKQLYNELPNYMTSSQLIKEKEFIEKHKPFSETNEWIASASQIFTDENFIEVLRILPNRYKLYVMPWGEDNENPFN
jgi:hypothetical protein